MKIVTLVVLGAALQLLASSTIEGLPFDIQAATFADWRDTIEQARNQTGVPGMSVAVLHKGKIIFAEGFGKRNKNGDPVTPDTLMPIGSMTKAMTAAMIGELVAEGKLDWDKTPVAEWVPEARFNPTLTAELTLSDYLSHRSGLPHSDLPWINSTETRAQVFRRLKNLDLPTKLTSSVQYSNIGFTIAGEAAANVAGIPYKRLVRNKIFRPLGLTHTGFSPLEMGKRANHAMPFYAENLKDAQEGKFHEGYLDSTYELLEAAGDVYSNMYDLLKWGSTIMKYGELDGKQVLNKAAVQEQLTAHTIYRSVRTIPELAPSSSYSFGWFGDSYKGQSMYYHGGNTLGFSSMIVLFPDSDLVIATLSNIYAAMLPNVLHYYLADEILNLPRTQDWMGKVALQMTEKVFNLTAEGARGNFPPRQKNKPTSHPLAQYVGVYTHPLFAGDVTITLEEKNTLAFRFKTFESKMEHYHFETFKFTLQLWSTKEAQLLTFIMDESGEVQGFQLKYIEKKWIFEKKEAFSSTKEEEKMVDCHMAVEQQKEEQEEFFGQEEEDSMQFKML
ncbi:hypothetical protein BGZ81_011024 [Podila clonocystis]|nr:hypothetical protein BGZ81_011024 [Podila clonocystis]